MDMLQCKYLGFISLKIIENETKISGNFSVDLIVANLEFCSTWWRWSNEVSILAFKKQKWRFKRIRRIHIDSYTDLCIVSIRDMDHTSLRNIYRWFKYGSNQFRRISDDYVKKYGFIVCRSSQRLLMQRLDQFVKKTWKITFQSSYSLKKTFDFKIDQYTKKSDYIYEFKGTENNQLLGNSKINGIVLFHNDEFHFCFQKIYDGKQNVGQQDSWGMLIYEIQEKANGYFQGIWFYEDFQTHPSYSGSMVMSEAVDNEKSSPKEYVPTTFFL